MMQICNRAPDQWERGPNDHSDCDASYIYAPPTFFLEIRPLRCEGPNAARGIAAQALFDEFFPLKECFEGVAGRNSKYMVEVGCEVKWCLL